MTWIAAKGERTVTISAPLKKVFAKKAIESGG